MEFKMMPTDNAPLITIPTQKPSYSKVPNQLFIWRPVNSHTIDLSKITWTLNLEGIASRSSSTPGLSDPQCQMSLRRLLPHRYQPGSDRTWPWTQPSSSGARALTTRTRKLWALWDLPEPGPGGHLGEADEPAGRWAGAGKLGRSGFLLLTPSMWLP